MTKRYYLDENGFIIGEIPPAIIPLDIGTPVTQRRKGSKQHRHIAIKERTDLVQCEFCNARVNPSRIQSHLEHVHHVRDTTLEQHEVSPVSKESPDQNLQIFTSTIPAQKAEHTQSTKHVQKVRCKICKAVMPIQDFRSHINVHISTPTPVNESGWVTCPVCHGNVTSKRLKKHLNKVHGASSETDKPKPVTPVQRKNQEDIVPESLYQDLSEKRDGSKGLGHMRREWDGKFGSFPLHDDYNDESDSG